MNLDNNQINFIVAIEIRPECIGDHSTLASRETHCSVGELMVILKQVTFEARIGPASSTNKDPDRRLHHNR
jgi:hypothetical protein